MLKQIIVVLFIGVLCFVAGQLTATGSKVGEGDTAELGPRLPAIPFVILEGEAKTQINISRTADLRTISHVTIFNKNSNSLYVTCYEDSGIVKELSIKVDGKYTRDFSFREDGKLRYATTYSPDPRNGAEVGERVYYDKKGNIERKESVTIAHGS